MKRKLFIHFITVFILVIIISLFTILTISILFYTFVSIAVESYFNIEVSSNVFWAVSIASAPVIFLFILLSLYYVKKMYEPLYFFTIWLQQLAKGDYTIPLPLNKRKKRMVFFHIFNDIYLNIELLTNKLKVNKNERINIEKKRLEWTAGVTHDLKTPLSYIQGYSSMVIDQPEHYTKEEVCELMKIVYDKSQHMKELIDELHFTLQLDQREYFINKVNSNIVLLIETIANDFRKLPKAELYEIQFESNLKEYKCYFDHMAMKRIISNITMNALIHNPINTKIIISCFYNEEKKQFQISIKDNGRGLSKEEQANLFNRYYRGTTTDKTSGTGLGLAITKQLVELHEAELLVESEIDKGTEITIVFNSGTSP